MNEEALEAKNSDGNQWIIPSIPFLSPLLDHPDQNECVKWINWIWSGKLALNRKHKIHLFPQNIRWEVKI